MAVTIKDVAQRAGVAVGTVSRVINQHADVNPHLRAKVQQAIDELQYRPNARAQHLGRNASPILSFILSNRTFVHPFHSHVLQGVAEYCEEAGHFVMFTKFDYSRETAADELQLPAVLQSHGVADCLILAGTNYENFAEALDSLNMRYVVLANNFVTTKPRPPVDQVRFDEETGTYEATRHLISLGHQRICFVGDTTRMWYRMRNAGYRRAMGEAGLPVREWTTALADDQFTDGLRGMEFLLENGEPPTAVIGGNDDVAYGAWEAVRRHGLEVPGDVSIIGIDDQYGPLREPQLTSVRVPTEEIGRLLAKMAIEKLRNPGKVIPEVVVHTQLMRRGTCRPVLSQVVKGA